MRLHDLKSQPLTALEPLTTAMYLLGFTCDDTTYHGGNGGLTSFRRSFRGRSQSRRCTLQDGYMSPRIHEVSALNLDNLSADCAIANASLWHTQQDSWSDNVEKI